VVGLTAFFAIAVDCGLGTVGVKRIAHAPHELPALAAQIPLVRLALALLTVPLMIGGMHALGSPSIPSGLVWLYAASLFFVALNQDWLLQSAELMAHVAFAQILRALGFAAMVFLLVEAAVDITAVGWAELTAVAAASIYLLMVQHFRVTPIRFPLAAFDVRGLVREGASIGLSRFAWAAAQYMPLFLVGSFAGGREVGWYAAGQRLVTSISSFSFVYHFNLYPALARASAVGSADLAELMRNSFRVTAWGSIGLALGLTLGAAPVLGMIFGERFELAALALAILAWTIPVIVLSGHARWALIVGDAQRHVLHAQLAGFATVTFTGVPLVLALGAVGAAAAAVAGSLAVWVVSHAFARRLEAAPPAFSLGAKPLLLALVLGYAAYFTGAEPLVEAIGVVFVYALTAPLIDRSLLPDLVRLAHARPGLRAEPR
jgi:O-antigen/teichoic acid export membrane protein